MTAYILLIKTCKIWEKRGAQAFAEDMERAKQLLHRIKDTQAKIAEMMQESNASTDENHEKRGTKK